jgi:hypothetical protein
MSLDARKNFCKVLVSVGYNASATSVILASGDGDKLPVAPFNVTWWNASDYADPSDDPNVEIVRVTDVTSDILTITRAQESTSAKTHNIALKQYEMILGVTAKTLDDIESALPVSGAFSWSDLIKLYPLLAPIRGFLNNYVPFTSSQPPCTVWLDGSTINIQGTIQKSSGSAASDDRLFNLPTGFEAAQNSFNPSAILDNTFGFQPGFVATDASVSPKTAFMVYTLSGVTTFNFLFCTANFRSAGIISGAFKATLSGPTDDVVVFLPGTLPNNNSGVKVCMYFHGLGDDAYSFFTSPDSATGTQNLFRTSLLALLADGWTVISCSGGNTNTDNWGNPTSWTASQNALNWIKGICNVTKIVALGQSMGGITSLRAAAYFSGITRWYGIYPCTNLGWLYQNQGSFVSSMNAAYSVSNFAGFQAATTATDPMLFSLSVFAGKSFRMTASPSDTLVNKTNNSDAFVARVTATATSAVVVAATGNHGDPSHFIPSDIVNFLDS